MLNANKQYYYNDKHLYFWFNDHHSSEYNLFIIAKNDLKIENSTGASTQYTNAMFQEGSYLLGTSRKQKTFKRKVAAEGLTLQRYKDMMLWLREGANGMLYFDSNPEWGWNVVLETVGDANVYYRGDELIVEFDLTWKTIGSYLATNRYVSMGINENIDGKDKQYIITSGHSTGLPSYFRTSTSDFLESTKCNYWYEVVHLGNEFQYLDCSLWFDPGKQPKYSLYLKNSNTKITRYIDAEFTTDNSLSTTLKYHGNSGFLFIDDQVAEASQRFIQNIQVNGLCTILNSPPVRLDLSRIQEQVDIYAAKKYTYIIEVQNINLNTTWGSAWDADKTRDLTTGLATSIIKIYKIANSQNITYNDNYAYYLVATSRIGMNAIPQNLIIHTYNNL